jgi:hypothetical protein
MMASYSLGKILRCQFMVGICNNNNERLFIYLGPEGVNMAAQEFSKWALRSSFVGCGLNKALREG